MSGIVLKRLLSKFVPRNEMNEDQIGSDYISRISMEINYLFGTALSKNDIPALKLLSSTVHDDLFEFFAQTTRVFSYTELVMKDITIGLARTMFSYQNTERKQLYVEITTEQLQALQEHLPDLKNKSKIYHYSARASGISVNNLHDLFISPKMISDYDQALLLLYSNMPDETSKKFRLQDLHDSVRKNIAVNMFTRVLSVHMYRPARGILRDEELRALSKDLPEHYRGLEQLSLVYSESLDLVNPRVSKEDLASNCLETPNPCSHGFPDRDLHIEKLTERKSLMQSVGIYLEHMKRLDYNLTKDENGKIVYGSQRFLNGAHNFISIMNEDVVLTRAAVKHIDKLCAYLEKHIEEENVQNSLPEIIRSLKMLFLRKDQPYMPVSTFVHSDLVTRCCIDLPLRGIGKVFCSYLERLRLDVVNRGENLTTETPVVKLASWMGSTLPDAALYSMIDKKLVHESLLKYMLFDKTKRTSDNAYAANPEFAIEQMAKLFGCAERNYPKSVTGHLPSGTATLPRNSIPYKIYEIEQKIEAENLYESAFHREYYKTFDISRAETPRVVADMSFIIAPNL